MNYTNIIINQLVTFVYIISCKLSTSKTRKRKPKLYASLFYGIINKRKKRKNKKKKKNSHFLIQLCELRLFLKQPVSLCKLYKHYFSILYSNTSNTLDSFVVVL